MKNFLQPLIYVAFLFSFLSVNAQVIIQFDKRFGGNGTDAAMNIMQTSDGGFILGGFSNSGNNGDKTDVNRGDWDYWFVKTDNQGNKMWDKTYGCNNNDAMIHIEQTSDEGYIMAGGSRSDACPDKTQNWFGCFNGAFDCFFDYWVIKTDKNGNKQWDKSYGGNGGDWASAVTQTSDGGYILAGQSNTGINGTKTQANFDSTLFTHDVWLVKTDANGNQLWDKVYGGTNNEITVGLGGDGLLQKTSDGGYIIGASSNSGISGNKSTPNRGDYDYWLVKLDANGNKMWDKTFGGTGRETILTVKQINDGGFIVGGISNSNASGDKSENSRGGFDFWFVRTDANGNKLWDKTLGGFGTEGGGGEIQQTSDGGFIFAGSSRSGAGGDKSEPNRGSGADFWLIKMNSNGNKLWDKTIGGNAEEISSSIILTPDGRYVVYGRSASDISGEKTENSRGAEDYWLVKFMETGNLSVNLSGSVINDADSNCVFNSSVDFGVPNRLLKATDTRANSYFIFSDANGNYNFRLPEGNYTVEQAPVTNDIFKVENCPSAPLSYSVTLSPNTSITGKIFFNVVQNPICSVSVNLTASYNPPLIAPCPGIQQTYCATFTNGGSAINNPVFSLTVDPNVTIIPNSATSSCCTSPMTSGQTITCTSNTAFPAGKTCTLCVNVIVNTSCPIPFPICFGIPLTTNASLTGICQNAPYSNSNALNETVSCAVDPNDKALTTPNGCGSSGNIPGNEELIYRIRFQNTGNAPAHNVVFQDALDKDLNLSTLKITASSHAISQIEVFPPSTLSISFFGIELPDSSSNPAGSHGFVTFSIKPKDSLPDGTTIVNQAAIYFDLNEPVLTNSTLNTIRDSIPKVTLSSFNALCVNSNPFTLTGGSPSGGTYSGGGVSNGTFYPSSAGVGTHLITYTHTSEYKETNYTLNQSGAFAPVSGSGTQVVLGDDQVSSALPIGFTFNFYGIAHTDFRISSNGFLTFNNDNNSACCNGTDLPNHLSSPSNIIAFAWDDLYPPGNGFIDYFTTGTAPNRKLIVNFTNIPLCCTSVPAITSQIILYENTNIIEIHTTMASANNGMTMGIENNGGTVGTVVPGRSNAVYSITNDFVQFIPPPPTSSCSQSATSSITVKPAPTATISVNGSTNLCPGQSVTLTASSSDSYLWSTGATTQSIIASVSGNYFVTVTANNCSATSEPINVTVNNIPCGKDKITICHLPPGNPDNPQTLCISESALQAHLAHGDYCGECAITTAKINNQQNWCGPNQYDNINKSSLCTPVAPYYNLPCYSKISRDSFVPTNNTPIRYMNLLVIVVDSNIYGVTQENVDTMVSLANKHFNPWKIHFCYSTVFVDSSSISQYPQNKDSIINVIIYDLPNSLLGYSGNPIKIDYSTVINNNYQGGYTLAHELGHDFGLPHIFQSLEGPPYSSFTCSDWCRDRVDYPLSVQDTVGDWMPDTPPTPRNYNCAPPQGTDTCSTGNPSWPAWGYENIMGYAICSNVTFSSDQSGMMHCLFNHVWSCTPCPQNIHNWLAYGDLHCAPPTSVNNLFSNENIIFEIVPNPFRETTTIRFMLLQNAHVKIEVRNYLGQHVATLYEQFVNKGQENKIQFNSVNLPAGIYFASLKSRQFFITKKLVIIK